MSNKQNLISTNITTQIGGRALVPKLPVVPAHEGIRTAGERFSLAPLTLSSKNQALPSTTTTEHALTGSPWHAQFSTAFSNETTLLERRISELRSPASPASLIVSAQKSLEERLFDATANVKILTAQVAMHLDREWRDKLFAQLDSLHNVEDWDRDDEPVRTGSFATFLKAVIQIKPQRRPGLGLSHNGHLIASWTVGKDRLTIEFLPNDNVRWVLARCVGNDMERFASHTSVSRLITSLAPYNPDYWFST